MKNIFNVEFYPTDKDIKDVWKDSLIVFDTSSLLNLYKYSKDTREQYLSVMKQVKERLWIPYHVGEEYFNNRVSTLLSEGMAYEDINKMLDKQFKEIESSINRVFKFREGDLNKLIEEVKKGFDKIKEVVSDSKRSRISFSPNTDTILEKLTEYFENRVGGNFTQEEAEKIKEEGKIRFKNRTPPGYCDRTKDDIKKNEFGDLIIWKQIINKSIKDRKNIILITDDRKEDWWLDVHGRTISPRKELYSEFFFETKQKILIYRPHVFMKYANEYLESNVDEKAMKEIVDVSSFLPEHLISNNLRIKNYLKQYLNLQPSDIEEVNLDKDAALEQYLDSKSVFDWLISDVENLNLFKEDPRISYLNWVNKARSKSDYFKQYYDTKQHYSNLMNTVENEMHLPDDVLKDYLKSKIQNKMLKRSNMNIENEFEKE